MLCAVAWPHHYTNVYMNPYNSELNVGTTVRYYDNPNFPMMIYACLHIHRVP